MRNRGQTTLEARWRDEGGDKARHEVLDALPRAPSGSCPLPLGKGLQGLLSLSCDGKIALLFSGWSNKEKLGKAQGATWVYVRTANHFQTVGSQALFISCLCYPVSSYKSLWWKVRASYPTVLSIWMPTVRVTIYRVFKGTMLSCCMNLRV